MQSTGGRRDVEAVSSYRSRRMFFKSTAVTFSATVLPQSSVLADAESVPDTTTLNRQLLSNSVNPFNSACMGFGCSDSNGLDDMGKPKPPEDVASIPYAAFLEALEAKKVTFVEFSPPNGDDAFATIEGVNNGLPILIGEGYPIERGDGWSSPLFVMRALDNAGVPHRYRFEFKKYNGFQPMPKYERPIHTSADFIPNSYARRGTE